VKSTSLADYIFNLQTSICQPYRRCLTIQYGSGLRNYTQCNWNVHTNSGHEFHISRQEKVCISHASGNINLWVIAERNHDCAPAHLSRAVRGVLSNTYHDRCIGRGGPTAWPPRSPDLNPLDFYLWGRLEILVHAAPVDNEEAPHHCILDACQNCRKGVYHPCSFMMSESDILLHALY
jgi:hypothetical protein